MAKDSDADSMKVNISDMCECCEPRTAPDGPSSQAARLAAFTNDHGLPILPPIRKIAVSKKVTKDETTCTCSDAKDKPKGSQDKS